MRAHLRYTAELCHSSDTMTEASVNGRGSSAETKTIAPFSFKVSSITLLKPLALWVQRLFGLGLCDCASGLWLSENPSKPKRP